MRFNKPPPQLCDPSAVMQSNVWRDCVLSTCPHRSVDLCLGWPFPPLLRRRRGGRPVRRTTAACSQLGPQYWLPGAHRAFSRRCAAPAGPTLIHVRGGRLLSRWNCRPQTWRPPRRHSSPARTRSAGCFASRQPSTRPFLCLAFQSLRQSKTAVSLAGGIYLTRTCGLHTHSSLAPGVGLGGLVPHPDRQVQL